jgi:AcrR family transcriptional regulator
MASTTSAHPRASRPYQSAVRTQRAAETRERIVGAGVALVEGLPDLDWSVMTFQAVAENAGVSRRTVFRHFANERDLHAAVMQRLQERAGVDYSDIDLEAVSPVARRVFESLASFSVVSWTSEPEDSAFTSMDRARGKALRSAVTAAMPEWSFEDQTLAAGVLDVLWNPMSYERLVAHWGTSADDAIRAIQWVIELVIRNVKAGGPDPFGRRTMPD